MSANQVNILEYIVCLVGAFSERFHITNGQAYRYLLQYKGLAFVFKHYEIEHTFSIEDAVEDCARICLRNGGALSL